MEKRITVTVNDYNRLLDLIELTTAGSPMPTFVNRLHTYLVNAKTVEQEAIDRRVVTMNSRVHLKDIMTKRQSEVTLTYPQEAEPRERKISVLSEIGLALLGKNESDIVSWKIPGKVGLFEIVKVNYQPEAAKDYYL
jgi:regulator of nucleoside diphosphate kinase